MPRNQTGMGHHATANLQEIVDSGRGDVPLKDVKFRCAKCGSRRTDSVMMGKGGVVYSRGGLRRGRGSPAAAAQTGRCDLTPASGGA